MRGGGERGEGRGRGNTHESLVIVQMVSLLTKCQGDFRLRCGHRPNVCYGFWERFSLVLSIFKVRLVIEFALGSAVYVTVERVGRGKEILLFQ